MALIEAENIYKEFEKRNTNVQVIKGISLKIEKGEFVSITGTSGSGKSTLLYLLSGMEPLTKGCVRIQGKTLNQMSNKEVSDLRRNDIGFVFQFYNLIAEMTVSDNVFLPSLIGKVPLDKKKLDELLEMVGLQNHKEKFPHELSGGEQQRVAIARAVYGVPSIIFADEPTGNLDSINSQEILRLLKEINKTYKTTIIQVTHDQKLAEKTDKIIKLEDGRIVYDTTNG